MPMDFDGNYQTRTRTRLIAVLSIFAACLAAYHLWAWWTSFDQPNPQPRPHVVMWDVVSYAQQMRGLEVAPGPLILDESLLIQFAARIFLTFGETYQAMVTSQLPFLFIFVIGCGLLAWRFGGPEAAALAPWIAVLGPVTIGLSVTLDDMLALQAMMVLTLVLIAWSDVTPLQWLALLAFRPVVFVIQMVLVESNGVIFLGILAVAAGSILLWQWGRWLLDKKYLTLKGVLTGPWIATIGVGLAFYFGIMESLPLPVEYVIAQEGHQRYAQLSVFENLKVIFACPGVWLLYHAGPAMALMTVGFVGWRIFKRKKLIDFVPALLWLLVPMIIFTIIKKRHEFYLITQIPATYILLAMGPAMFEKRARRILASVFIVVVMAGSWAWSMTVPWYKTTTSIPLRGLFEAHPVPYILPPKLQPYNMIAVPIELGAWIATECTKVGDEVQFVEHSQINGWMAFHAWHVNPDLRIFDTVTGPTHEPSPCLVTFNPLQHSIPYDLKPYLKWAKKLALNECYTERDCIPVRIRFEMIEEIADSYQVASAFAFDAWQVFLKKDKIIP